MAVNESRDMLTELRLGATDGTFKSTSPDRGGEMSMDTTLARDALNGSQVYDILDTPMDIRRMPTGEWSKWNYGRR